MVVEVGYVDVGIECGLELCGDFGGDVIFVCVLFDCGDIGGEEF